MKKEKTSRHRYKSFLRGCFQLSLQCKSRIRARRHKLTIVYSTGHVWFRVGVDGGGGGKRKGRDEFSIYLPPPLSFLLTIAYPPLVQKSFYPQPSAVVKIKDSRYTFNQEDWALARQNYVCFISYFQLYVEINPIVHEASKQATNAAKENTWDFLSTKVRFASISFSLSFFKERILVRW